MEKENLEQDLEGRQAPGLAGGEGKCCSLKGWPGQDPTGGREHASLRV